jgi:hypothetical protein
MDFLKLKIIKPKNEIIEEIKDPVIPSITTPVSLAQHMSLIDKERFSKKNQEGIWSNELVKITQKQYADIFKAEESGASKKELQAIVQEADLKRKEIQNMIWASKKDRAILFKNFKFCQDNSRIPNQKEITTMQSRHKERDLVTDPVAMLAAYNNIRCETYRIKRILREGKIERKGHKTKMLSDSDREDYSKKLEREMGYLKHYEAALKKAKK